MHTKFHRCLVLSPSMRVKQLRKARWNVLVLLALGSAEESPTCILHEGTHTPQHAQSKNHTQLATLSFDQKSVLLILTAKVYFFIKI